MLYLFSFLSPYRLVTVQYIFYSFSYFYTTYEGGTEYLFAARKIRFFLAAETATVEKSTSIQQTDIRHDKERHKR